MFHDGETVAELLVSECEASVEHTLGCALRADGVHSERAAAADVDEADGLGAGAAQETSQPEHCGGC